MAQLTPVRFIALSLAALSLLAGGCLMNADYSVMVTTADGVTIEVPLSNTFAPGPSASDDAAGVTNFRFIPNSKGDVKTIGYAFMIKFEKGCVPTSIVVDDVSEDPIKLLFTDTNPKLFDGVRWEAATPGFNPNDEKANWVMGLDNGVRTFRFTITLADKSVHVLRLPIFVPSNAKAIFRAELGIK